MDLHICDFLPCESFVPLHDLAGNVCISKRRFLPWATARAFMSFFIQDFDIYLCASYTSKWLFWYNLGYAVRLHSSHHQTRHGNFPVTKIAGTAHYFLSKPD